VSIPVRILVVLIGVRLLLPPGICICKLSSPVVRVVADALGGDPTAPAPDDDDHDPGCPASVLSLGMGVKPASPTLDAPAALPCPADPPPALAVACGRIDAPPSDAAAFDAPPLYVCHCALLI